MSKLTDISSADSSIGADFSKVDNLIRRALETDVELISRLANYIIRGGGKRLRPLLALISAKAAGYEGENHIKIAAIIEFIHTATLLHDDVVDESAQRRGRDTANEVFGNQAAVLTGDFLYSKSFQMMVEINNMEVMRNLADTTNIIAEGEVMQLMSINEPDINEDEYFEVINRKTARLFASACELGAIIAGQNYKYKEALNSFGKHLGNAFQLIDDALDYDINNNGIGKNHGDDLANGKITLPLIYAVRTGNSREQKLIRDAIINEQKDMFSEVVEIINRTGAIDYTKDKAKSEIDRALKALAGLPPSIYRDRLGEIAANSLNRQS